MRLPFRAKVDDKRRVTIPVDECAERNIEPGDQVMLDPMLLKKSEENDITESECSEVKGD